MVGSPHLATRVTLALLVVLLVIGCATPAPPTNDGDAVPLQGLWSLSGNGANLDVDGPMTLSFPSNTSGIARFLGSSDRNGVTSCRSYAFVLVDDAILFLQSSLFDNETFVVTTIDDDQLRLTSDVSDLTLTRVTGAAPVADCGGVDLATVATIDGRPNSTSGLVGVGSRLYFNRSASPQPIVGYDVTTNTVGPDRAFTQSVGGGTDRYIMAAFDDDVFYGQCWCGSVQRFSAFNATTDTHIVQVNTNTDFGLPTWMRFGVYDAAIGKVWLGGRSSTATDVNRLFLLDPATLALDSHRTLLEGASITDLSILDGVMYALIADDAAIVSIGTDGRATQTWSIPRSAITGTLRGLGTASGALHLLVDDWRAGHAVLLAVTLD